MQGERQEGVFSANLQGEVGRGREGGRTEGEREDRTEGMREDRTEGEREDRTEAEGGEIQRGRKAETGCSLRECDFNTQWYSGDLIVIEHTMVSDNRCSDSRCFHTHTNTTQCNVCVCTRNHRVVITAPSVYTYTHSTTQHSVYSHYCPNEWSLNSPYTVHVLLGQV